MKRYINATTSVPVINELPETQEECVNKIENKITVDDILEMMGFTPFEDCFVAQMNNQLVIASPKDNSIYIVDNYHGDNGEEVDVPAYETFPFYVIDQYIKSGESDLIKFCYSTDYFIYDHKLSEQHILSDIMDDFYNF